MAGRRTIRAFRNTFAATLKIAGIMFVLSAFCSAADSQEKQLSNDAVAVDNAKPANRLVLNPPVPGIKAPGTALVTDRPAPTASQFKELPHQGINWKGLLAQDAIFLGIEQGFRLGTQPGTREALRGPFFDDWFESVKATHGWGDGDDFLTNYIGHPMEGSVSSFIFVQNDGRGRNLVFDWKSRYWASRLKAMAWTALYSAQFELGPCSEASIGNVGHQGTSQSGAVDLVVTPLAGMGWQVGEDVLDKYVIARLETWTNNKALLVFARGFLNPTRSFANMIRFKVPWHRDTRPGIWQRDIMLPPQNGSNPMAREK